MSWSDTFIACFSSQTGVSVFSLSQNYNFTEFIDSTGEHRFLFHLSPRRSKVRVNHRTPGLELGGNQTVAFKYSSGQIEV